MFVFGRNFRLGIAPLEAVLDDADSEAALTLAKEAIALLRQKRDKYLAALSTTASSDTQEVLFSLSNFLPV